MRKRWIAAALAGALALAAAAQSSAATLEAENLVAAPDAFTTSASCDTQHDSTVSWTAEGMATGPFPGTFTLSGTLHIGPQTMPGQHPPGPDREGTVAGPITSFQESFTIHSGTTTITGTKTVDPQASSGAIGTCQQVTRFPILGFFDGQGTVVEVNAQALYAAQIHPAAGAATTDSGRSNATVVDLNITGACPTGPACQGRLAGFFESFTLSDQLACNDDESEPKGDDCEDDD